VTLLPGTILQGATVIGDNCEIGPNTRLIDTVVGSGTCVQSTAARGSTIGSGAKVGPFANLEPGSSVADNAITSSFYDGQQ
jgi:bifunctional UDP-N-acetylglucosamine pyrophosphorylase/glucosamine-1-phosphate N-acetyltransferase